VDLDQKITPGIVVFTVRIQVIILAMLMLRLDEEHESF